MKQKDTILLILTIIISIVMLFSMILSFIYTNVTVESRFWGFMFITSISTLGSIAFVSLLIMLIQKFKDADTLSISEDDSKTLITRVRRKLKYLLIIFQCIGFFIIIGTVVSEQAISVFLGPNLFPYDVYAFLFVSGLMMIFLMGIPLGIIDNKVSKRIEKT